MSVRKERVFTIFLLAAVLLNGLLWSVISPLWQGPDERAHYGMIQFIGEFRRLPTAEDIYMPDEEVEAVGLIEFDRVIFKPGRRQDFGLTSEGPNEPLIASLSPELRTSFDYQQLCTAMRLPPLYHILGALFYTLARSGSILARGFAVRVGSVCCAALATFVWVRASSLIFPDDQDMQWTLPIVLGFHPMFTFLGSVISPEILLILEMTALTYVGVRVMRSGLNWLRAGALGALMGAGIATRPEMWAMLLPVAYLFFLEFRARGKRVLRLLLITVVVMTLCGGWQLIRSYQLNQNLLYGSPIDPTRKRERIPRPGYYPWHYTLDYVRELWGSLLVTYWGGFGHTLTNLPPQWYTVVRAIVAVGSLGFIVQVLKRVRASIWGPDEIILLFLVLVASSVVIGLGARGFLRMRQGSRMFQPSKGRYLIGPLAAQMTLFAFGFVGMLPAALKRWGHLFLRVFFLALNAGALLFLVYRYYL